MEERTGDGVDMLGEEYQILVQKVNQVVRVIKEKLDKLVIKVIKEIRVMQ